MGRIFLVELEGRTYKCKFCKTNLSLAENVVSRGFHCRRGKAYLFSNVGRIIDGLDSEFYIDTRPSSSDAEEA
ncbi:Yippee-like protein [Cynara cardunculus var. scolymus]|uniref:Yippee-like protein n=1 Tax=Cynara cardunculus var. scolymus TaxID=59895 RepID=A0A118K6D4_CYNCS|nr:Yippee-like protein [Cynara cardunculus var. scolymus]